ncbi:XRE family transcriptional regulator [Streptomyces coeruleoprunus]|uniref:XRE family transcriptional regulator n=1 Tax=Streptomyces coeruleoprunus TaxID=285563 RepID=A0ABV9XNW4_9ACTN
MPRWKALPDELDPQVREFAGQLRRLVDRSGLSIAAVADRTGYSKTSWERYLNGRLLAPKGAVLALAEVTGTNTVHLTTMWELAERAWSRAEMRHDRTMEAIRIAQARAALGDTGATPVAAGPAGPAPYAVIPPDGGPNGPGYRGPALPPQAQPQPVTAPVPAQSPAAGKAKAKAKAERKSKAKARAGAPAPARPKDQQGSRPVVMFLAGAVGALLVIAAAFLLTDLGGKQAGHRAGGTTAARSPSPSPTPSTPQSLPPGVKCAGASCTGQDPERMGCGGQYARTVSSAVVGAAHVEVRYSETCGAAWARITRAVPGDSVRVTVGGTTQDGTVRNDDDAYTPMVAAKGGAGAKACATLKTGAQGCTAG